MIAHGTPAAWCAGHRPLRPVEQCAIKTVEPPVSGGLSLRSAAFMQDLQDAIDARLDDIRNDLFRAASLMPAVRSHQTNPWRGDTMSTELTELNAKLRSKTRE